MTLITATQLTSRARCARRASLPSLGTLGPSVTATALCHSQHVRSFRFGRLWASYFDPEFTRDNCRRHRHFRYKYAETLNRRLSWDQNSPAADATKPTVKRVLGTYWASTSTDNDDGAKFGGLDASQKTLDNPDGTRPGQNIEDAERAPLEDLLFGNGGQNQTNWSDKKHSSLHKGKKSKNYSRRTPSQTQGSFAEVDVEYVIDPITNRKVPKSANGRAYSVPDIGVELPLDSFKSYRSQFAPFAAPDDVDAQAPIFYDGPPPESELKKYGQVKIDATPRDSACKTTTQVTSTLDGLPVPTLTEPESSVLDAIAGKHQEVFWHQSDGIASGSRAWAFGTDTSEGASQAPDQDTVHKYEDLDKYDAVGYQEPDGKSPEQEPPQKYEDLKKYIAVRSHEPDGKYKAEADSAEKERKGLEEYKAVMSHEPDGKYKVLEHSTSRAYEDMPKYGAVRSHEPDGKYRSEDGVTQQYEDLHKYDAVRSHEPDGKYKAPENATGQHYEDLEQYGTIRANEPDGKYKAEQDSADQHYDDLHKYGPVKIHEPDGKYKPQQDAPVHQYEDLHKYGAVIAHEPDGKYKAEAEAEASTASEVDPEELRQYTAFRSHEPDGMYAASYGKPSPDPEELSGYMAFRSHEPDGKYAANYTKSTEDRVEEVRYQAFRSHEPDGKYSPNQQVDPTAGYSDLETYGAFRSHEPDGRYAKENSESAEHPEELYQYHAARSHEPDGKHAAESESCTEVPDLGNHEAFGYEDSETKVAPPGNEDVADLKEYKGVRRSEPSGQSELQPEESCKPGDAGEELEAMRQKSAEELTTDQTEFNGNIESQSTSQSASISELEKTEYRKLQEFLLSEVTAEYAAAYPVDNSILDKTNDLPNSLIGNDLDATLAKAQKPIHQIPGSSTRPSNLLEPALDRRSKPGRVFAGKPSVLDPYSKEPQGLETSYVQECGETVPVIATIYCPANLESQSPEPEVSTTALPASNAPEPTLYKILVYDPTMQSVEVAETTSIVPDTATLTPADVLLRISNPSKFLPHFAPLQAQGYEIVSGGGDILIFRKVRDAVTATQDQPASDPAVSVSASISSHPLVNPIDMTGGGLRDYDVAASRFASPTGFVNYNLPPLNYESSCPPPTKRFRSGIEVHREELVFSGSNTRTAEKREKETKSLFKRLLIGAVWVGGLSYSLAVVGDYFKTGGADEKGSRGRF